MGVPHLKRWFCVHVMYASFNENEIRSLFFVKIARILCALPPFLDAKSHFKDYRCGFTLNEELVLVCSVLLVA